MLLDTATLERRHVPLPADLALIVVDSGVRRRLEDTAYAQRRREIEAAVALLGGRLPRDVSPADAVATLRRAGAGDLLQRRLRHLVRENQRVREVADLLERRPVDRPLLGQLLREGHESLRDDLEVSTPALDRLVELAYDGGAVGARMMGGGFGGSVLVLAHRSDAEALTARVIARYGVETGNVAQCFVMEAADGAHERAPVEG
jgi:galactokinase